MLMKKKRNRYNFEWKISHDENNTDENSNDNDENKSHDTFFLLIT